MLNASGNFIPLKRRTIAAIFPRRLIIIMIAAANIIFALDFNFCS